jgi:hypothetical protein
MLKNLKETTMHKELKKNQTGVSPENPIKGIMIMKKKQIELLK